MSILIFLIVLTLLVFVHELGHFLTAKKFDMRVDEFGIGFPPKLFGKRYGETEYTLNALPIGGFVSIFGENPEQSVENAPDRSRSFGAKPRWQQAIVLVAGVTFNILFAWFLYVIGFTFGMPAAIDETNQENAWDVKVLVTGVLPGSPAQEAGLLPGDELVAVRYVDGDSVTTTSQSPQDISEFIAQYPGKEVTFEYRRGDEYKVSTLIPQTEIIPEDPERAAAGFSMSLAGIIRLPVYEAIYEGFKMTVNNLGAITVSLATFVAEAFRLNADIDQFAGPVGIVGIVGDVSALGFAYLISFTAFISLNLAVINLLPFPALDGGRLVMVGIESLIRRPIPSSISNNLNRIGFVLLILLMIAVTFNDILKLL